MSRCGRGLTEPRFSGALEGYLVVDTLSGSLGEARLLALLRNYGSERRVSVEVVVCGSTVARGRYTLKAGGRLVLEVYTTIRDSCEARLVVDGTTVDGEAIAPLDLPSSGNPPYVVLVFHHHQPPNYGPDGSYRSLWPFTYVWKPLLAPYGLGPYHYHYVLLRRLGMGVRVVYNLSPSLLKQWHDLLSGGIRTVSGEVVEPGSEIAEVVGEALGGYRELATSRSIEVLTSIYAHTIAGYLAETYGLEGVVRRELEYGYSVTRDVVGVDPRGVWLPEMSFSMKLVPILSSLGLEYTFLDSTYHLGGAEGDVGSPYEPYVVEGSGGSSVAVLFRDTGLSNDVAFLNNYCSDVHAAKAAYVFTRKLLGRCSGGGVRVLTVALDGENWMALSENPPATAVFLKTLLTLLRNLSRRGVIKLSTAGEALKAVPPVRRLRYVPPTSWLGSYTKWRGERVEHERFWRAVELRLARYREYVARYGLDERARRAEWALWHVLDSDYWWAEFWDGEAISLWIEEFDKHITESH